MGQHEGDGMIHAAPAERWCAIKTLMIQNRDFGSWEDGKTRSNKQASDLLSKKKKGGGGNQMHFCSDGLLSVEHCPSSKASPD